MGQSTATTARDLIRRAMMLAGILGQGENPAANEANDGLRTLNQLIEAWATENLMIYGTTEIMVPMVVGQDFYTWGVGGDINAPFPVQPIDSAWLTITSTTPATRMNIKMLSDVEWQELSTPTIDSTYPVYVYVNRGYPMGKLHVWPVPNVAQSFITFLTRVQWTSGVANLDTVLDLAPGYTKALEYGLAVEIASLFGRTVPEAVLGQAVGSKARIKATNSPISFSNIDPAVLTHGGIWNWRTGDYN